MRAFIATHNKAFRAEWLKLKRSGIIWLCLGAAAFVPLINTIANFFIDNSSMEEQNAWQLFIESNCIGFTSLFFPLFLIIMMIRIVYLEHRSDTWKLLETQPVPKLSLFLAKYEVALLISLISLLCMLIFTLLGGLSLQIFKPDSDLKNASIDWSATATILLRYWITSLSILAIQYFLALIIKSFAWPLTIGLISIIVGSIFVNLGVFSWFPYAASILTSASIKGSQTGSFLLHHEKMSLLWTALFLWLAFQFYVRKHFTKAFFSPARRLIPTVIVLLLFAVLFWRINKPMAVDRYGKTLLTGTIKGDKPVDRIVVFGAGIFDTLLSAPVRNGTFHISTTQPIEKGIYYLKAGNQRTPFFWGEKDSVHISWTMKLNSNEVKFGGTRLAENSFINANRNDYYYLTNFAYQFKPDAYAAEIMDEWQKGVRRIEKFKTVDNIRPSDDFIQLQKKLLAVQLLYLLDVIYPQTFSVYYPNDVLNYPPHINQLRRQVSLNDSSLLSFEDYTTYVSDYLHHKARSSTSSDSLFFRFANDSLRGSVKDKILFGELQKKLSLQSDSVRRTAWLQTFLSTVHNTRYQQQLLEQAQQINNLQRGRKAHNFSAEALNGNSYSLHNLSGRYVVIDVWATWCGPCKKESPHFEQLAEQYTSENVAFVSVSVDENKNAWKMDAPRKSKRVLQLWAKNAAEDFMKLYAVNTIPRFVLIDPKGKILNAQMPYPSDPEFEQVLQKEIPFLTAF